MNFKKRLNGSWVDTSCYIHKTATDTFANLPATLYPTGVTSTVELKGNTVQSGTPTPDIPVDVAGCGAKTENLFDIDNAIKNYYLKNGVPTQFNSGRYVLSDYIPIASDTATISAKITISSFFGAHWAVYDENKTFIRGGVAFDAYGSGIRVRDVNTSGAAFIRVDYSMEYLTDCMLNLGSTPLPYEPYGYKIPISSGGVTTNIYLGSTSSTRQIKKYVMTGNETMDGYDSAYTRISVDIPELTSIGLRSTPCLSSHYIGIYDGRPIEQVPNNSIYTGGSGKHSIIVKENDYTTRDAYKAYLQAQYAAGTPVTIWFAIPTPETAAVNEPLMKIDDYADIVSDISVPVTAGGDTISVDTTLQPSEVAINYKGWHNAKCKEYSYNMTIADWESASISQMENHTIQELQGGNWV